MSEAEETGLPESIQMNHFPVELRCLRRDEEGRVWWGADLNKYTKVRACAGRNRVYLSIETRTKFGTCLADLEAETLGEAELMLRDAIVDAMNAATILRNALPPMRDEEAA